MTQDGSNLALLSTIIVIINTIIIIIIQNFTRASQNTTRAIISRKELVDIWSEPENLKITRQILIITNVMMLQIQIMQQL